MAIDPNPFSEATRQATTRVATQVATVAQAHWDGPLGTMILATTAHGLCGAWFTDQGHVPAKTPWPMQPEHPVLAAAQNQLRDYFAGQRRHFDLPLDLGAGTQFQQDIWRALLGIAQGRTSTYGQVSVASGHANAVRAVGGAIGRNPLSIIVPCHRVIGANGTLTGYDGGLHRKSFLLTLEGVL